MLGLYLHIPFCQSICSYCNFNRGLFDAVLKLKYVDALEREILDAGRGEPADTIFFGGGTPSILDPADIARLIDACRRGYAIAPTSEITLETNPETVSDDRLAGFRAAGVNRVSLGVQSFDDDELARLGRVHSSSRAVEAITMAMAAGFDSVSFDLMLWLPGQTRESWRRTMDRAVTLGPDHLSLYLLELYPNAPLKEAMARSAHPPPALIGQTGVTDSAAWTQAADDEAADMYLEAFEALDAAGYEQYEISNVAKPGHVSRHNVKYWQMGSWRGFGCGAHSTVDGLRWKNIASTGEYVDRVIRGGAVRQDEHQLSRQQRLEETLFTGLRLNAGIDRGNFAGEFGVDPWVAHAEVLEPCEAAGLAWSANGRFGLTRRGMLVANEILSTFV